MKKLEHQFMKTLRSLVVMLLCCHAAQAQNITGAEYFLDTDPGVGYGIPILTGAASDSVSFSGIINTFGLTAGEHFIYVRTQTDSGTWSLHTTPQSFYIKTLITDAEYFWDTDPGVGNATPIAVSNSFDMVNVSTSITTVGLSTGAHNLYVRTRTEGNNWSLHAQQHIYIRSSIVGAEYFWDADPGVGNGTPISLTAALDSVAFSGSVSTSGLMPGEHRLYVRAKNENGVWGLHQQERIEITNSIAAAEYFFDTDPGVGNGTALNISSPADTVNEGASIQVPLLSPGIHFVYVRTQSVNGVWSLHSRDSIDVLPCVYATASISGDTVFCNGNSTTVSFNGTPDAIVIYHVTGNASNDTLTLDGSGFASVSTGVINATTTYKLITAYDAGYTACQTALNDSAVVVTGPCNLCNSVPHRPTYINSLDDVKACPGETRSYEIGLTSDADLYQWTAPAGASILSGQGTTNVTVLFQSGFTADDTLRVVGVNACGISNERIRKVKFGNLPLRPSFITGLQDGVCELNDVAYAVDSMAGMSYNWSFDVVGASVTSGQGTSNVLAAYTDSFSSGNILVSAVNGCGAGLPRSLSIMAPIKKLDAISGPSTACPNEMNVAFSVPAAASATSYTWKAPNGSTISDGNTTSTGNILTTPSNAITINFGNITGIVKVFASNSCGDSRSSLKVVYKGCGAREASESIQEGNLALELYPNPANDILNAAFDATKEGAYHFRVVDALGKTVLFGDGFATDGSNRITIEVSALAAGTYHFLLDAAGISYNQNFVVKQ